jgi:hypothetical protein
MKRQEPLTPDFWPEGREDFGDLVAIPVGAELPATVSLGDQRYRELLVAQCASPSATR